MRHKEGHSTVNADEGVTLTTRYKSHKHVCRKPRHTKICKLDIVENIEGDTGSDTAIEGAFHAVSLNGWVSQSEN